MPSVPQSGPDGWSEPPALLLAAAEDGWADLPAIRLALAAADRETNRAIREWATKRGMKIAERGRIPADVLAAYYDEGAGSGPRAVAS